MLVYRVDSQELAGIPSARLGKLYLAEVWRGLPRIELKNLPARNGQLGQRYEGSDGYIWIVPDAVEALVRDSGTLLNVIGSRGRKGFDLQVDVCPESNLRDAVRAAAAFNSEAIKQYRDKLKRCARSTPRPTLDARRRAEWAEWSARYEQRQR